MNKKKIHHYIIFLLYIYEELSLTDSAIFLFTQYKSLINLSAENKSIVYILLLSIIRALESDLQRPKIFLDAVAM